MIKDEYRRPIWTSTGEKVLQNRSNELKKFKPDFVDRLWIINLVFSIKLVATF